MFVPAEIRFKLNFPGYTLYISLDIVLSWESYPQLHKLIFI